MTITTTPNVQRVLRADPVLAMTVELLRREPRPGYLHLSRMDRRAPFTAVYFPADYRSRRKAESRDLADAILRVLEEAAA